MPTVLPFTLPATFGDDAITAVTPPFPNHIDVARSQVIEQYKGLPNLDALIFAFATQTQALEVVQQQLAALTSIDGNVGQQLDNIGARLDEPRQGFDDASYRLHLKARIALNRSSGTIEDILGLFAQLVGPGVTLTLAEWFPAGLTVTLGGVAVDRTTALYLAGFLKAARDGGVGARLEWSESPPAATFAFAGATGLGFDSGGYWASADSA